MSKHADVMADLAVDGAVLDELLSGLKGRQWAVQTPAPGWTVAHQVAHLAATFKLAAVAAGNPTGFAAVASRLSENFSANVDAALAEYLSDPPEVLLTRWRAERTAAEKALAALPPDKMVPWLVRPVPAAVLAAAGMMEMFGHGQDIADALGVRPRHTDRLRHIVAFAVHTWDFGYLARGLPTPDVQFRYELTAPSGQLWEFGPADGPQRITGPAVDFCLLVVRRRHPDDLGLTATGRDAKHWLTIAQAYRGPAGEGRRSGQFATQS